MSEQDRQRLDAAATLLRAGRIGQANSALRELTTDQPDFAEAHALLGEARAASGDKVGAEASLRRALLLDPRLSAAATRLADMLIERHRAAEAINLLEGLAGAPGAGAALLNTYGIALRSEGRVNEAVEAHRAAAEAAPAEGAYAHNLAGALGDAELFAESEAACQRAFAMGLDAPETWLVKGRALMGLGRLDEADDALRQGIRRRPGFAEAHAELAQLIWMRTEDPDAALAALDTAIKLSPFDPNLHLAKAKLLEYADGPSAAYASLGVALDTAPSDLQLQITAARLALGQDGATAMSHALRAEAIDPTNAQAAAAMCQANLALGRPEVAAVIAETLCADWPMDQHPITLAATAWRMLGDARYRELFDYERLVRAETIDTPSGWSSLGTYLGELSASLHAIQRLRGHPIGQSLRHGAQTGQSLTRSDDPAIRAFFGAIDRPIRDFIALLADRDDVLGRRVTKDYRFTGAWSVLLRPGGHHVNHIHQLGWISSAFHVELPGAVEDGRQGWLKFGEPGLPTDPPLPAEHFVKPKVGDLVLFPSYMWHGTVPFAGDAPRLAIAFDVVPA